MGERNTEEGGGEEYRKEWINVKENRWIGMKCKTKRNRIIGDTKEVN